MRIVFMGTPDFAVPSLKVLLQSPYRVVGVVTQPDRPKGRGKTLTASPIKALAQEKTLPIFQPERMKAQDFLETLQDWAADVIVVAAFGRILPKIILDLPRRGCVNVHASLLPSYRGAAPIQWALINGDHETGVSTMLMDEGMDTGAILLQERVSICPEETAGELSVRLATVGANLLSNTLRELAAGTLLPCPQSHDNATLAPLLRKEHGNIDWFLSAEHIVNTVRGLSPWPGSYTSLQGTRFTIWKASILLDQQGINGEVVSPGTVVSVEKKGCVVATGDGLLRITELQMANKKRMATEQFLEGYQVLPGMRFMAQP